nr:Ig domain-containing protein [uncultured Actinoplanes sp.]
MRRRQAADDEGFSLIETVVALTVVVVTMGAMGTYLISSFGVVAHQRAEQAAAQLANSALEQVRALRGSSLSSGHGKTRAYAQFGLDPAGAVSATVPQPPDAVADYLTDMTPAWDATADPDAGDDAAISTATLPVTVDRTTYDRTIYLGECEVDLGSDEGQNGECDPAAARTATDDATKYMKFFRAVVLVTWRDRFCALSTCTYVTSTLISRAADPTFDINRPTPVINRNGLNPIYFYEGVAVNFTIPVYGGTLPDKWTVLPAMPDGLTVNQDGVITGTPTRVGTWPTTGEVTDSSKPTGRRSPTTALNFTVVKPPSITALPAAKNHVGEAVSLPITLTGGTSAISCGLSKPPTGLTVDATNTITGSYAGPLTAAKTFPSIKIVCTDRPRSVPDRRAYSTYQHTFYPAVTLTPPADQQITLGSPVSATATASGGDQAFTYSATDLPVGVTINQSTGAISGTPTIPGRYVPTITVTDGLGGTGGTVSKTFVLIVTTPSTSLVFTSPAFGDSLDRTTAVNTPASLGPFTTNAALLGLTATMSATGLPPGLTFNPLTRTISGTPTTARTDPYKVTVTATNLVPPASTRYSFLWTIK